MQGIRKHRLVLVACAALLFWSQPANADDTKKPGKGETVAMPTPAEVQALAIQPTTVTLRGVDDSAQLIVTGQVAEGRLQDLTGDIKYEVANPALGA